MCHIFIYLMYVYVVHMHIFAKKNEEHFAELFLLLWKYIITQTFYIFLSLHKYSVLVDGLHIVLQQVQCRKKTNQHVKNLYVTFIAAAFNFTIKMYNLSLHANVMFRYRHSVILIVFVLICHYLTV